MSCITLLVEMAHPSRFHLQKRSADAVRERNGRSPAGRALRNGFKTLSSVSFGAHASFTCDVTRRGALLTKSIYAVNSSQDRKVAADERINPDMHAENAIRYDNPCNNILC